jgi:hypothetical protein
MNEQVKPVFSAVFMARLIAVKVYVGTLNGTPPLTFDNLNDVVKVAVHGHIICQFTGMSHGRAR